jgi:hypothetical protein
MTLLDVIPWVLMAGSMALILILPLLSDGPRLEPTRQSQRSLSRFSFPETEGDGKREVRTGVMKREV